MRKKRAGAVVDAVRLREDGEVGTVKAVGSCGAGATVRKGIRVPLSEDEQRILNEMEQKLFENDRHFAHRVNSPRASVARVAGTPRPGVSYRLAALVFVVGFIVLLTSFRSSIVLATLGFVMMFGSALMVERRLHSRLGTQAQSGSTSSGDGTAQTSDVADSLRRLRSRFWQQH